MKKIGISFLTILSIILLAACNSGSQTEDNNLLNQVYSKLEIERTITSDISLSSNIDNVDIKWESSKPNSISAEGKVTRFANDEDLILTAHLEKNGNKKDKEFNVTVLKDESASKFKNVFSKLNEQVTLVGSVILETKDGFYLYDDALAIFVKTDNKNVSLNDIIKVTGVVSEENNMVLIDQSNIEQYEGKKAEELNLNTKLLKNYTNLYALSSASFSTVVASNGIVYLDNEEVYIKYDAETIKVSNRTQDAAINLLKQKESEKVTFTGVFDNFQNGQWEIVLGNIVEDNFTSLTIGEKQGEVISWIEKQVPDKLDKDSSNLELPSTHPVFGGNITWDLTGSQNVIGESGTINHISESTKFVLVYNLQISGIANHRGEIEVLYVADAVNNISDFISSEYYDIAKCNVDEVMGEDCWDESGNYAAEDNIFNVQGKVLFIEGTEIILTNIEYTDTSTTPQIIVLKTIPEVVAKVTAGDNLKFAETHYSTEGYRPTLFSSNLINIESGDIDVTQIALEEKEYATVESMDLESFDTYSTLFKLKKIYLTNLNTASDPLFGGTYNTYAFSTPEYSNASYIDGATLIIDMKAHTKKLFQEIDFNLAGVYLDLIGFVNKGENVYNDLKVNFNTVIKPELSELNDQDKIDLIKVRIDNFTKTPDAFAHVYYNYNTTRNDAGFVNDIVGIYAKVTSMVAYDYNDNELNQGEYIKDGFSLGGTLNLNFTGRNITDPRTYKKILVTYVLTDESGNPLSNAEGDIEFEHGFIG